MRVAKGFWSRVFGLAAAMTVVANIQFGKWWWLTGMLLWIAIREIAFEAVDRKLERG